MLICIVWTLKKIWHTTVSMHREELEKRRRRRRISLKDQMQMKTLEID